MYKNLRLWIDDIRSPESLFILSAVHPWTVCRTSASGILTLASWQAEGVDEIERVSFDHDLGLEDTTRPVVFWLIENHFHVRHVTVHSKNPVGAEWIFETIKRHRVSKDSLKYL